MLTVSSLTPQQLADRLAGPGIYLRTGAFVSHLQSAIPQVAEGLSLLYADYPLLAHSDLPDFRLRLARPASVRRWFRPQVQLIQDGIQSFQPLPLAQAYPMFEWGLNWCISGSAHSYLIIHAAVVEKDGCAAILPAPPGSGKSTLCAALVHHGWRLLSDELALVRPADGLLIPMPRPISLKNASIELMQRYLPSPVFSPAVADTEKGTVAHLKAPADSVARSGDTARPAWLIFPKYVAGAAPVLTPLPKARAHVQVAANSFNYSLLGQQGFETLAGLVEQSACYRFSYSALDDAIALFAGLRPTLP